MDMMNRDTFRARGVKIKELYERLNRATMTSHNRGHIIVEQRQKMKELQEQLDFLENIIEDALTTYYGDDCYYQLKQDYNAYQKEFFEVKEDRPHKDPGKARAAKVHRVPTVNGPPPKKVFPKGGISGSGGSMPQIITQTEIKIK